jgi:hypothetical protein
VAGSEYQAGIDPGACRAFTVGFLLLPEELKGGDARAGKGKRTLAWMLI